MRFFGRQDLSQIGTNLVAFLFDMRGDMKVSLVAQRYRGVVMRVFVLLCYFLVFHAELSRVFAEYCYVYFWGVVISILIAEMKLRGLRRRIRLLHALVMPLIGSIIGYSMLSLEFALKHGYFVKISIYEWIFVCTISAYFLSKLWIVSLAFAVISEFVPDEEP